MYFQKINLIFFLVGLNFLLSCGKTSEQKVTDAILSSDIYLSKKDCQSSIDILEAVGRQSKNARYLKNLASSYACRAGYSTVTFFGSDIAKSVNNPPLGGLTTYTTSLVTTTSPLADDTKFKDLQTAIDILLYAGGLSTSTEPTIVNRAVNFSTNDAGDINAELAFMQLVQLGKLMKVYADTSAGVKGAGGGTNNCFTDYTSTIAAVQTYITTGGLTGACTSTSSSNSQLALGVSERRKKLCQGVVLLNGVLNVLPGVLAAGGGGDLNSISNLTQEIEDQKTALLAIDASFAPTATVMSQYNCENSSNISEVSLSSYYALFFETLVL